MGGVPLPAGADAADTGRLACHHGHSSSIAAAVKYNTEIGSPFWAVCCCDFETGIPDGVTGEAVNRGSLPTMYEIRSGVGRNGSSGLVVDSNQGYTHAIFPIRVDAPGHIYRISCWVLPDLHYGWSYPCNPGIELRDADDNIIAAITSMQVGVYVDTDGNYMCNYYVGLWRKLTIEIDTATGEIRHAVFLDDSNYPATHESVITNSDIVGIAPSEVRLCAYSQLGTFAANTFDELLIELKPTLRGACHTMAIDNLGVVATSKLHVGSVGFGEPGRMVRGIRAHCPRVCGTSTRLLPIEAECVRECSVSAYRDVETITTVRTHSARVGEPLVANFATVRPPGGMPLDVWFIDRSAGAPGYEMHWDFGDGNTSDEQSPIHTYTLPGKYDVILCVENELQASRMLKTIDNTQIPDVSGDVHGWMRENEPDGDPPVYYSYVHGQATPPEDLVAMDIASGLTHSAAIRPDGSVATWGGGGPGVHEIPDDLAATAIAAGSDCTAAIREDGSVVVWGTRGEYIYEYDNEIFDVPDGLIAKSISLTQHHALAIGSDGQVVAWGWNQFGQCNVPPDLTAISVAAGYNHSVAVKRDGTVVCWGDVSDGACNPPPGLTAVSVCAGHLFTAALCEDGSVVCWGRSTSGRCDVPDGLVAKEIAVGTAHCVAIRHDNTVVAWGDNSALQCDITPGYRATKVSAGEYHTLGIGSVEVQPRFDVTCTDVEEGGGNYVLAQFVDRSIGSPTGWYWDFGDGFESFEQHPEHAYRTPGDHVATLTVSREQYVSSTQRTVTGPARSSKNVDFLVSSPRGRVPFVVEFFNQSQSGATKWHWDFGDGETSDDEEPVHTYVGRGHYLVTLIATYADGTSSRTRWVEATYGGVPRFVANQMGPIVPLGVQFTCKSDGPIVSRVWHFGDGVTSVSENPFHTYAEEGYYVATLRIVCVECGVEYSVITSRVVHAHRGEQIVLWGYSVGWHGGGLEQPLIPLITSTDNAELLFCQCNDYHRVHRVNKLNGDQWGFTLAHTVSNEGVFPPKPPEYFAATIAIAGDAGDGGAGPAIKKYRADVYLGVDGNIFFAHHPDSTEWVQYGVSIPKPADMVDIVDFDRTMEHIYGLRADGRIVVWGPSSELVYANKPSGPYPPGQEWTASYDGALVAEAIPQGLRATKIASRYLESNCYCMIALATDGNLVVWGSGGDNPDDYLIPPEAIHGVLDIGTGYTTTAVLKSDGTLGVWDREGNPRAMNGLTNVTKMRVSDEAVIALMDDGTVETNALYNPYSRDANYPVEVLPATDVAVARNDLCAAIAGLIVHCTGINVSRPSGIAPHTVEFSESSYDAAYYVAFTLRYVYSYDWTWEWDFGDGSTEIVHLPESPGYDTYGPRPDIDPKLLWGAVTHTYHEPGVYDVSLRLTSMYGTESIHVKMGAVTVYPRVPPIAEFSHEADPDLERTIEFVDESQRGPSEWHWDFGDGNESIEQYPTHAYAADGVYVTTLTVANDMGVDATSDLVEAYSTHSVDMVPVRGLVYDAEVKLLTGRDIPLAGATVTVGSIATETDEDGAFELLVPATYYPDRKVPVVICHVGYEIATKHVPIDDPDAPPVAFRVWPTVQYASDGRV